MREPRRRTLLSALAGLGALGLVGPARAQRVSRPIAPGGGAGAIAGRFNDGGVASGVTPGVFTVVSTDARANTMQLRDDEGRTGTVHVSGDLFDVETVKPGDRVQVDFKVPVEGSKGLEAGGVWKVQR